MNELSQIKGSSMALHTLTPSKRLEITKAIMHYLIKIIGVDVSKNPLKLSAVEEMIEKNARRLTPLEIKKAFDMYISGNLQNLEPISGLLDSITFNKVINQYKQQKNEKHQEYKVQISDEEKAENEYLNIIYAWDEWKQEKKVPLDYHWVYDSLKDRGLLKVSDEESKSLNEYLRETYPNFSREKKLKKGKCLLVERFFKKLKVPVKELL